MVIVLFELTTKILKFVLYFRQDDQVNIIVALREFNSFADVLLMYDFVFYCIIFILCFVVHMCECHLY